MIGRLRRNRVGSRNQELWSWEVEEVKKMTGPLAVQEYIQEVIRNDSANVERIIEKPPSVDLNIWKYEQVRQFVLELNLLATSLKELCTRETCPTMKGSPEAQFLCASHKTPLPCAAIDYMVHNLDQATSILLNIKHFASRVSISETKSLDTIVRRLYRLFAHTYHCHPEVYQEFEKDMHLCRRFTAFALKFNFMDSSMLLIPPFE